MLCVRVCVLSFLHLLSYQYIFSFCFPPSSSATSSFVLRCLSVHFVCCFFFFLHSSLSFYYMRKFKYFYHNNINEKGGARRQKPSEETHKVKYNKKKKFPFFFTDEAKSVKFSVLFSFLSWACCFFSFLPFLSSMGRFSSSVLSLPKLVISVK